LPEIVKNTKIFLKGIMSSFHHIGIVGAGAFGTALAVVAKEAGHSVSMWCREEYIAKCIQEKYENPTYLKNVPLPQGIKASTDFKQLKESDLLLLVTPSHSVPFIIQNLVEHQFNTRPLLVCSKGFMPESGQMTTDFLQEHLPGFPCAVLSGPNIAIEIAQKLPAATTIACKDKSLAEKLIQTFSTPFFRPYASTDILGAQICGALKNIIAIACGITVGCELGDNARSALITRGLTEIKRFGKALGGKESTFMGLAGLGDLTLTCNSFKSRNMSLGIALGQGQKLADILKKSHSVYEGIYAVPHVLNKAEQLGLKMPITEAVHNILYLQAPIHKEVYQLMTRPLGHED
jgi:glycerol-3-phosphate dehydrogenase (NAD(P)+)